MPTQTVEPPDVELRKALYMSRHYRHQPDCVCCEYRGPDGAGYCGVDHYRWNATINRLLDVAIVCSVTAKARRHL